MMQFCRGSPTRHAPERHGDAVQDEDQRAGRAQVDEEARQ